MSLSKSIFASACAFFCGISVCVAQNAVPLPLDLAAPIMLNRDHNAGCGKEKDSDFKAQLDFTHAATVTQPHPWETIEFSTHPEDYMHAVLDAAIADNEPIAWKIGEHPVNGWVHAPWLAQDREPFDGLTRERSSLPFELAPTQTDRRSNYAIGFYNATAAASFRDVWANPAQPKTATLRMGEGAVAVKLLFSTATADEVPWLKGARTVSICSNNGPIDGHLTQIDIAVRDHRADPWTGWVFGTFIYQSDGTETFSWDNVKPFTLQWGNNPGVWPTGLAALGRPVALSDLPTVDHSWFNADLQKQIATGRMSKGLDPWTGLFGRANGPIDNPVSSCLSCHNVAADFGRGSARNPDMAPEPPWAKEIIQGTTPREALTAFFEDRGPAVPKLPGTLALDYSLQAMIGILNFRAWAECRGDTVVADIAPFPGPKPEQLTDEICKRVLAASGDVTFVPTTAVPSPEATNETLFRQSRPNEILKSLAVQGGTSNFPHEMRTFR